MKRIVKQIVAILIAVGFVGSIVFFIPHVPNSTPVAYNILIPNNLLRPNSTFYSLAPVTLGNVNVSSIGGIGESTVSAVLTNTNSTNLLQLTEFLLSQDGFSYVQGNGRLVCVSSPQLVTEVCDNGTYDWTLFSGSGSASLGLYDNSLNASLSAITINSLSTNTSFFLVYYNPTAATGTANNTGIPKFTG